MMAYPKLLLTSIFATCIGLQANAVGPSCSELFGGTAVLNAKQVLQKYGDRPGMRNVVNALAKIQAIDPQVLAGNKTPSWYDFEIISQIRPALKEHAMISKIMIKTGAAKSNDLQSLYVELNQAWSSANRRAQIEGLRDSKDRSTSYAPGEYGLKLGFQMTLQALNDYLPSQMRFPAPKLSKDLTTPAINAEAKLIVEAMAYENDRLMQSQGVASYEGLKKSISESADAEVRSNLNNLENEHFQFAMNRPDRGRFWIEHAGFQNQHVTNTSGGFTGKKARNAVEATYLNVEYDPYSKAHDDLKPKYGSLVIGNASQENNLSHYGDDLYTFKKSSLDGRVTFTLGDSLNAMSQLRRMGFAVGKTEVATTWDHIFTPWSRRAILAPFIKSYSKETEIQSSSIDPTLPLKRAHAGSEYVELQIWGNLTLDHVETFTFTGTPPSGTFLKALKARQISIFDKRSGLAKPWQEPG